jgi:ATP-dependent RNA helicase DeaD
MEFFDDLGLEAALVEVLAAEGAESPTALQAKAIPVLRRGHDLILRAGPGSGLTAAYGLPILERVDASIPGVQALILTPDLARAEGVAESLARLAQGLGVGVAALSPGWADPMEASVLVAPTAAAATELAEGRLDAANLRCVVAESLLQVIRSGGKKRAESIFESLAEECQRVVTALPVDADVQAFGARFLRRATQVPPRVPPGDQRAEPRGTIEFRVSTEDRMADAAQATAALLGQGAGHVLAFTRTEDEAADLGDLLSLHGFLAGAPGEAECPVWLGIDAMEGRAALSRMEDPEQVATLSVTPPFDPDTLDRRHGAGGTAVALVAPRELPHLRGIAEEAGYQLSRPLQQAATGSDGDDQRRVPADLMAQLTTAGGGVPHPDLPELLARFGSERIAAAAVAALMERDRKTEESDLAEGRIPGVSAWVKIFLTVGAKDDVRAGDIVGAITGETSIPGKQVGRIEIKDTYSRVEVPQELAREVVEGLNGTSIRGRSIRADYDRGQRDREMGEGPGAGSAADRGPAREGRGRKPGGRRLKRPGE